MHIEFDHSRFVKSLPSIKIGQKLIKSTFKDLVHFRFGANSFKFDLVLTPCAICRMKAYLERIVSTLLFVICCHLELLEVVLGVHYVRVDAVHVQRGAQLGPRVLLLHGRGSSDQATHVIILGQVSVASLDSPEPCLLENMVDLHDEDNTITSNSFEKTLNLCYMKFC